MKLANIIATATALLQADFDESQHPRAKDGKFASGGELNDEQHALLTSGGYYKNSPENPNRYDHTSLGGHVDISNGVLSYYTSSGKLDKINTESKAHELGLKSATGKNLTGPTFQEVQKNQYHSFKETGRHSVEDGGDRFDNLSLTTDGKKGISNAPFQTDLTDSEKQAVSAYAKNDMYDVINGYLRSGKTADASAETKNVTSELERAFAHSSIQHNAVLYRGTSAQPFLGLQAGDVWKPQGFVSTSAVDGELFVNKQTLKQHDAVEWTILCPKGTPAVNVTPHAKYAYEEEVLLNHQQPMRIVSVDKVVRPVYISDPNPKAKGSMLKTERTIYRITARAISEDLIKSGDRIITANDDVCASCESGDCQIHAGGPGSGRHKDLVYFHGTPSKNLEAIMKDGLKPDPTRSDRAGGGFVYLSPKLATAHYFGNSGSGETGKYVVLKVTVPASDAAKVEKDPIHPFKSDKAVRIKGTILPSQISISSINPTRYSTRSSEDFEDVTAGGPGSGRHKTIGDTIRTVVRVTGMHPSEINRGMCEDMAMKIARSHPQVTVHHGIGHTFVEHAGKFYDAEHPAGVNHPRLLTTYGGSAKAVTQDEIEQHSAKDYIKNVSNGMNDEFRSIHAGGPGSGRHSESIPVLKEGQRGVGKSDGAVFPVHGPKSDLPGRHFSHGQYAQQRGDMWTAPNKKIPGGTLTVQRANNEDGSVKVTRYTTYKQGPKAVTQPSEVLQYPDKQSADAHMMKRFGITAISAREDRIRAFTLDALQCDFDESMHPRDKGGKFASKGESGAQPITPSKKIAQLNQMGFQYKGSHLDVNGKVTKDVFEKHGTDHEVHVSKYNTSHPGNADLRKYAVVNKNSGTTIQQGHQISKVQDFVNNNHLSGQTTTAPVQTPAATKPAYAPPAQTPIAEPWKVGNGGNTAGTEGKALQNAGFTYKSSSGAEDLWTHPSGAYVQVLPSGFKVGSANGDEEKVSDPANKDWEGKQVHEAIDKAVADSQAVKNAPTEPVTVPTGKMPADDKISSKSEQQTLTQNGFQYLMTTSSGSAETWQHPSGATINVAKDGYSVFDGSGNKLGEGGTVYETIGKLDKPIKDAIDNAGKPSTGLVNPGGSQHPIDPELTIHDVPMTALDAENKAMATAGFSYIGTKPGPAGTGTDVDVFQHSNGTKVETDAESHVKIIAPDGSVTHTNGMLHSSVIQDALKSATGSSQPAAIQTPTPAVSIKPAPAGVEPNKAGFKQNYYKQEGFVFTGKGPYDSDVWKHPSGVTVQVMATKHNVIMPGEAKKSYQGTPTSWDMKQYVGKAQMQTPAQPAALVSKPASTGSILQPATQQAFKNAGLAPSGTQGTKETWTTGDGVKLSVEKGGSLGAIGWQVHDKDNKLIEEHKDTGVVSGKAISPSIKLAIEKASTPVDHPTKAAGPVVPASGKNTALTGEGYQFQKHENGSDYWTKPGAAYGVKITATDATHSGFDVIDNKTGAVHTSGKDAGSMISTLSQVNGPKPSPQAQQYVPPTPIPAGPKKDWTENTDKAWQQKARDTVASLWSKAPDSAKAYTNNPTGVYNDIAKALGVPFSRLQEVKDRIGSWQGGTTAASGGNKIGTWAQDIVNNRDQIHPGLFIEHLVTQERIKDQYGGVVPTLYRGLHSPGDPESAGSGPAKGNIGVLKGLAQMSGEGFHTNFPVYGAEGFSSAKSVSTSFSSGSGVVITKAQGNLPSNWIMTSRDINPGMWTGYAGEHEWAVACPEVKDSKTGTMIPKLPIDTEKGDHVQGAGIVNAAMDPEEAENRVFELLANLKQSGWDYSLDGKEITVYPPVGWTNAAWFAEARKHQTAITASEEKPVRKMMVPGLPPISIEYEMGQTRTGTDQNGRAWSHVMPYAYGRFTGTNGLDGEPVDVILGRNPQSKKVFVVCLPKNLGNEEKVMVGFDTLQQAKIAFLACYGYQSKYLQTIGEITKPLLMTLMKVKNGKSAMLQQPREVKIAAEADYFESTPGLNVLPTSRPPSLKNHQPVDDPLATDGWHQDDSAQSKQQAREDMAQILNRTSRQAGNKPTLARTAAMNYDSPYPDVIL